MDNRGSALDSGYGEVLAHCGYSVANFGAVGDEGAVGDQAGIGAGVYPRLSTCRCTDLCCDGWDDRGRSFFGMESVGARVNGDIPEVLREKGECQRLAR